MFWKSAQQERIDSDAVIIAGLRERLERAEDLNRRYAIGQGVMREEIDSLRESAYGADRTAAMYKKLYEAATKTLGEIAGLETANCAHIGKRMARMARAELPMLHHEANGTAAAVQAVQ